MKGGRAALAIALLAACTEDAASTRPRIGSTSPSDGGTTNDAGVTVLDDATAIAWLETNCKGCHGPSDQGALDATWPKPAILTREWLEVSETTSTVYALLKKKRDGVHDGTFPSPMPVSAADGAPDVGAIVQWLEATMPERAFESATPRPVPVRTYTCQSPLSGRAFLERLTQAALVRAPTVVEAAAIPDPDQPLSPDARKALVGRLRTDWKSEFLAGGLRTFAQIISTVGATPYPGWTRPEGTKEPYNDAVLADGRQELYRLFLAHFDEWDYRDYFTAKVVMTSPNTADFYGCANTTGDWQECPLVAPRGGFFTTLTYLNLLGQSFLLNTTNVRRFSGLHFTLVGEGTARTGIYRAAAAPPPDCIDPTDSREVAGAGGPGFDPAVGAARILRSDAVCQNCHLQKGVAAGMTLFRPFASNGRVFQLDQWDTDVMPDRPALDAAVAPGHWIYRSSPDGPAIPVSRPFMKSLLDPANIHACIWTPGAANPYELLSSVDDLARHFLENTPAIARGFARHANRAYRDLIDGPPIGTAIDKNTMPTKEPKLITIELATKSTAAFDASAAKLPDLLEMYFASDSFACND